MRRVGIAVIAAAVVFAPPVSQADETAGLRGHLIDASSGKPISGASVIIEGPGFKRDVAANRDGFYSILGLSPGEYTVVFSGSGYGCNISFLTLDSGEARTVDFKDRPVKGLLHCVARLYLPLVDPDQTQDEYTDW